MSNTSGDISNAQSACKNSFAIMKGVAIVIYAITWLLQLCEYNNNSTVAQTDTV
jgi:hypothetical protein